MRATLIHYEDTPIPDTDIVIKAHVGSTGGTPKQTKLVIEDIREVKDVPIKRYFKDIYFDGAGDTSKENAHLLHTLLDRALSNLSGIQQCPHATESQDSIDAYEKECKKAEQENFIILQDIICALTGEEVFVDDTLDESFYRAQKKAIKKGLLDD